VCGIDSTGSGHIKVPRSCGNSNAYFASRLTTSWTVRGSIPVGRDFPPVQTGPGAHPTSCTMGTGSLPGVKYGRGVLLTTHPFLVPRSWKSRAILLPTLWATTGPVMGTIYPYISLPYSAGNVLTS